VDAADVRPVLLDPVQMILDRGQRRDALRAGGARKPDMPCRQVVLQAPGFAGTSVIEGRHAPQDAEAGMSGGLWRGSTGPVLGAGPGRVRGPARVGRPCAGYADG